MNERSASSRLNLAHQATMVDDARRVLAAARRGTRSHQATTQGTPAGESDDMGDIYIGDVTHQSTSNQAARGVLSTLAKAGVMAALVSSGAGLAVLAPAVLDRLTAPTAVTGPLPPPPAAPSPPPVPGPLAIDNDTQYQLQLAD